MESFVGGPDNLNAALLETLKTDVDRALQFVRPCGGVCLGRSVADSVNRIQ